MWGVFLSDNHLWGVFYRIIIWMCILSDNHLWGVFYRIIICSYEGVFYRIIICLYEGVFYRRIICLYKVFFLSENHLRIWRCTLSETLLWMWGCIYRINPTFWWELQLPINSYPNFSRYWIGTDLKLSENTSRTGDRTSVAWTHQYAFDTFMHLWIFYMKYAF